MIPMVDIRTRVKKLEKEVRALKNQDRFLDEEDYEALQDYRKEKPNIL